MATIRKVQPRQMRLTPRHVRLRAGSATVSASDLKGLRSAWRSRQLVLFLGAGVSIPYGLPSWKNFVLELLFEQAERTRRLGRLWPHYRRALASWMTDYFEYDPLVLARMVERNPCSGLLRHLVAEASAPRVLIPSSNNCGRIFTPIATEAVERIRALYRIEKEI